METAVERGSNKRVLPGVEMKQTCSVLLFSEEKREQKLRNGVLVVYSFAWNMVISLMEEGKPDGVGMLFCRDSEKLESFYNETWRNIKTEAIVREEKGELIGGMIGVRSTCFGTAFSEFGMGDWFDMRLATTPANKLETLNYGLELPDDTRLEIDFMRNEFNLLERAYLNLSAIQTTDRAIFSQMAKR